MTALLLGSPPSSLSPSLTDTHYQFFVDGANEACPVLYANARVQFDNRLAHCPSVRSMLSEMLVHGARKAVVVWDNTNNELRETLVWQGARALSLDLPPLGSNNDDAPLRFSLAFAADACAHDVPGSVVEPSLVMALSKPPPELCPATLWLSHNFSITIEGLSVQTCLHVSRIDVLTLTASKPSALACSNLVLYVNLAATSATGEFLAWHRAPLSRQTCILSMFGGSGIGGLSLYCHIYLQSCRITDDGTSLRVECLVRDTRLLW
jgi:hypothetical protein